MLEVEEIGGREVKTKSRENNKREKVGRRKGEKVE